jgi:hypothetical protein
MGMGFEAAKNGVEHPAQETAARGVLNICGRGRHLETS